MNHALSNKMDPFESYKLYNALKLHFETDGYDAIKYNYKTRVNANSFFKRRDKYFFAKLGKSYGKNLVKYYVSNFIKDVKYVGDMLGPDGESNYNDMIKVHESLSYRFKNDINILYNQGIEFDNLFKSQSGQLPMVIKLWMQGEISLETVVILNSILGYTRREKISDTLTWPDTKRKIEKYAPFVQFDVNKCSNILTKVFTIE